MINATLSNNKFRFAFCLCSALFVCFSYCCDVVVVVAVCYCFLAVLAIDVFDLLMLRVGITRANVAYEQRSARHCSYAVLPLRWLLAFSCVWVSVCVCVCAYVFMFLFLAARSIVLFMLIPNSLAKRGDKSLHFMAQLKQISAEWIRVGIIIIFRGVYIIRGDKQIALQIGHCD